jgi:hypothetical protein
MAWRPDGRAAAAVLLAGLVAAAPGCTSRSSIARPGIIARWEKTLGQPKEASVPRRALADAPGARCLKDRLSAANLRADIAALEARRGGARVTGRWRNVDRSQMPPPQGQFLSQRADDPMQGGWIYTDGIDFSSCTDVPCILNQVYGTPNGEQGLKVYWWFLRTGYVLSCTNVVPASAQSTKPFRDLLFDDAELTAFWRLSYALTDTFYSLRGIQTFHRFAKGEAPADWSDPRNPFVRTCGDAHGGGRAGFIRLADCGVRLDDPAQMTGNFYTTVTHEIAHKLDFALSGDDWNRLAEKPEWLAFSGWTHSDSTDPATGVITRTWTYDGSKEGFVRDYAKTSPAEDWADTVARFRFHPVDTLREAPQKSAFISARAFGGRTYDPPGLGRAYEELAARSVTPQLLELVQACVQGGGAQAPAADGGAPAAAIAGAAHLSFDTPVPEAIVTCLEQGLQQRVTAALEQVRATEWEACGYLDANEADVRAKIFIRLNPEIRRLTAEQAALAPMLRASRALREALLTEVDPREAYLHCHRRERPEECYSLALQERFDRLSVPYASDLGQGLAREREIFLEAAPYASSAAKVNEYFRQTFAGSDRLVAQAAATAWRTCFGAAAVPGPADDVPAEVIPTQPFTGGDQFVSAELLTCLNRRALDDVNATRDRFASRLGISVSDPDAAALVQDLLLPRYLEVLNGEVRREAVAESAERARRREPVVTAVAMQMAADAARWATGVPSRDAAIAACVEQAGPRFDAAVRGLDPPLPMRFSTPEDLRLLWSREACTQASGTRDAATLIDSGRVAAARAAAQAWARALVELEGMVLAQSVSREDRCRRENPGTGYLPERRRKRCLESVWPNVLAAGLADWAGSETGRRYESRRAEAQRHLVQRTPALQASAVSRMERR